MCLLFFFLNEAMFGILGARNISTVFSRDTSIA